MRTLATVLLALVACNDAPRADPAREAEAREAAKLDVAEGKRKADEHADDLLGAIAREAVRARRVDQADWKWATCHDEQKGFDAVLACAVAAEEAIAAEAAGMASPSATTTCGKEIEEVSQRFVRAQLVHHKKMTEFLRSHRAQLEGRLGAATLGTACGGSACPDKPMRDLEADNFARVLGITCPAVAFRCGKRSCSVNVLLESLGVTGSASPVTVIGTERVVTLPKVEQSKGNTIELKNL